MGVQGGGRGLEPKRKGAKVAHLEMKGWRTESAKSRAVRNRQRNKGSTGNRMEKEINVQGGQEKF